MTDIPTPAFSAGHGELAAALAKAQAAFPAITRSRTVRVKTKVGGEYVFKYAPLDKIFDAVRKPLADNGLAITQLIDGQELVTMLLHSAGATISGRAPLPNSGTIQEFGSAITYLRRYALQAILGIASEEDDDGNAASGNRATAVGPEARDPYDAGLVGIAEKGKGDADFELRLEAKHGHKLVFRLVEGRTGIKVVALGPLAELIAEYRDGIEGQRVTAWGEIEDKEFTPSDAKRPVKYQVLNVSRLKVGVLDLTAPDVEPDESEEPAA